jgi:hypothetical protein
MSSFIDYIVGAANFIPHGYCLLWRPDLVVMHALSDGVIAASYFSIPVALGVFVTRRKDIQFPWMFWLFAIFIFACGATHVAALLTLWWPAYGAQGLLKVATAIVSAMTAVVLWPLIRRLLHCRVPNSCAARTRVCGGSSMRESRHSLSCSRFSMQRRWPCWSSTTREL